MAYKQSQFEDESIFEHAEMFPAFNMARMVDKLIEERGIEAAAAHASWVARAARAMKNDDAAGDWDKVYRKIIERRGT